MQGKDVRVARVPEKAIPQHGEATFGATAHLEFDNVLVSVAEHSYAEIDFAFWGVNGASKLNTVLIVHEDDRRLQFQQ